MCMCVCVLTCAQVWVQMSGSFLNVSWHYFWRHLFFFFLINPYFPDSDRLAGQHQESFYLSISTSIAIIDWSSSESHCALWVPSPHDHEMNSYFLAKAENAWKQVSSSFFLLACAIYWIIPSPRSHGMGSWHPLWLHLKIRPSWK